MNADKGEVLAGAAAVKITPPPGTPMAGYYYVRPAAGVHDDLHAKAIVLESGGAMAALVALDLLTTTRWVAEEARREIERATGIPGAQVMISATHAHTGPVLGGPDAGWFFGSDNDLVRQYTAALPARIAEAVKLACAARRPVTVLAGEGREDSIAFNRRYRMKDGTVGWNPGKLNPNIVKPVGRIDPALPVVYFETPQRAPVALYANYTVHLDNVGGAEISSDLPCTLAKLLAEATGSSLLTLYTTGACGDVNHLDVKWAEPQHGHANAARMGTLLAAEVLRALPKLQPLRSSGLRCRHEMVELDLPELAPGGVERAQAVIAKVRSAAATQPQFLEQVEAFKVADVAERAGKPQVVEVQVIALGAEVAWVALPGEIFVELGLKIKAASPFRHTIIAELANGSIGYIPTARAWPQGNYEVVSARCAKGSGERLVKTAVRLLKELAKADR
ncbi:MAG: hypothetical protein ABSE73_08150 [Planctomycetota bacterium]